MSKDIIEIVNGPMITREEQKVGRLGYTDYLQEMVVPYYEKKESNNPNRVYQIYSKMIKNILFEVAPSYEKIYLEFLVPEQIKFMAHAEKMCVEFLETGMNKDMPYKELYKFVRDEMIELGLPKTKVPHANYISSSTATAPAITHNQKAS